MHEIARAVWGDAAPSVESLELFLRMLATTQIEPARASASGASEAATSAQCLLEHAERGVVLWRNNVGALQDAQGRWVRYGLCNDSKTLNERFKSGDLIGIAPTLVTADMVGARVGVFVSVECKARGWRYSGRGRELAQARWAALVRSMGGRAYFYNGEEE